uniref:Uncharacterized protein n=1 Tax=Ditylenchus dipsaci TaxID=166011 RepID=A0A915D9I7_9BILA
MYQDDHQPCCSQSFNAKVHQELNENGEIASIISVPRVDTGVLSMHSSPYLEYLIRLEEAIAIMRPSTYRPHLSYFQVSLESFLNWDFNLLNRVEEFEVS